jgi:hypothetical protein
MQRIVVASLLAVSVFIAPARAQQPRSVSLGVAAGVPATTGGGSLAMATLELGRASFPVRFRADVTVMDYATSGPRLAQLNANVLVPFLDRKISPYAVAGYASAPVTRFGSAGPGAEGLRAGMGLRYRIASRTLFLESVRHWGINRSQLSLGVQF